MSKLFLFAVGGTGARVLRSFTMLLASGIEGFESPTEVVPIIIDHDRQCGDKKRTTRVLDEYYKIYQGLYPNGNTTSYNDHFFMTRITPLMKLGVTGAPIGADGDWCLDFGPTGSVKFSEFIGINDIEANPQLAETLGLLHALYDTSSDTEPTAELNVNLNVGFKGKPNIGTVVFNELKGKREFRHFLAKCAPNDKVFIIGSLFGGTGSSGIPEIVKAIRNSGAACAGVPIGAALMLPYFGLEPNNHQNDGLNTGAIDPAMFNAKTKMALESYGVGGAHGFNRQVSVYYVGDEIKKTSNVYNEGADSQRNPAHVAEFIAAQAIIHFWLTPVDGALQAFEFGTVNDGSTEAFNLSSFYPQTHQMSLNSLSAFVIAMRYYRELVRGERNQVNPTTSFYSQQGFNLSANLNRGVYSYIDNFLGVPANNDWGFYSWLNELSQQPHSLKLYNVQTPALNDILTHKEEVKGGLFHAPITSDNNLNSKMNSITQNMNPKDVTSFFRALRILGKDIYNNIK